MNTKSTLTPPLRQNAPNTTPPGTSSGVSLSGGVGLSNDVIAFLQESNYIESEYTSAALDQAVKAWTFLLKQKELTMANILKTHSILMRNLLDHSDIGAW